MPSPAPHIASSRAAARILITPLNWGLGHATRSLAVAAALRDAAARQGRPADIHWASDGDALALLRRERPDDTIHELPGADVRYPTRSMTVNMLLAAPKLARTILAETRATAKMHARFDFDLIISDNRYGCRVAGVPSAIVTHQVHLPLPAGPSRTLANAINHWLLRRFDEVLVPDYPGPRALAGPMSAPLDGATMRYLGPVSRLASVVSRIDDRGRIPPGGRHLAVVLSGPEPQRTALEEAVLARVAELGAGSRVTLVRGLPRGGGSTLPQNLLAVPRAAGVSLEVVDFLTSDAIGALYATADALLVRAGYTTVMDLAALGCRAVWVPTPGQPEQEWLARSLAGGGYGIALRQDELDEPGVLATAVRRLIESGTHFPHTSSSETRADSHELAAVGTSYNATTGGFAEVDPSTAAPAHDAFRGLSPKPHEAATSGFAAADSSTAALDHDAFRGLSPKPQDAATSGFAEADSSTAAPVHDAFRGLSPKPHDAATSGFAEADSSTAALDHDAFRGLSPKPHDAATGGFAAADSSTGAAAHDAFRGLSPKPQDAATSGFAEAESSTGAPAHDAKSDLSPKLEHDADDAPDGDALARWAEARLSTIGRPTVNKL